MKSGNYINPVYKLSLRDANTVPRKISYSQWSMYDRCPLSWKLAYIDGLAPFQASIDTCFGTAFHETFQYFIEVMYTDSVKRAEALDLRSILTNKLREEYAKCVQEMGQHFSNPLQLAEYLEDGVAILEWFKKRRKQYFSTKDWELIGIEVELCTPASPNNPSVYLYGFIDLVIRHIPTNTIHVFDIKTSRSGWNKHQKADPTKAAQLVIYKNKFSEQFGIPKENIIVEFFIVKRKMVEESMFPQKRIQLFRPSSGTVTQRKVQRQIDEFVEQCFDSEGNKLADRQYMAISGKGDKNCKYCFAKTREDLCPKANRIRQ
jgi:hypothetical protein